MKNATKRAILYARVSTSRQAEEGLSLETQESRLVAFASALDLQVVEFIADAGISAKSLSNRPGMLRALALLEAGAADTLIVVSLSRLSRSLRDISTLVEDYFSDRFNLLAVDGSIRTDSANGRMLAGILGAVAQHEREQCAERVRTGILFKRSQGGFIGGTAPFGFALVDGALVPVPAEQEAIALSRELRAQGATLQATSDALAAQGFLARNGKAFAPVQISRMVASAYAVAA